MAKIDFISDINAGLEKEFDFPDIDRFIVRVLWWHFGAIVIHACLVSVMQIADYYPSPLAWRVVGLQGAFVAVAIGAVATSLPAVLIGRIQNHYLWRILVAVSFTFYSYLFVYLSGGAIEMHFHFFMILALLLVYADWRIGWFVLVLTGLHHGILNYVEPGWVYFYGRNDLSVVAHALPVLMMVIFTTVLSNIARKSIVDLKASAQTLRTKSDELESLKNQLEETVTVRTGELATKVEELGKMNGLMVDRELKMMELKKRVAELEGQSAG